MFSRQPRVDQNRWRLKAEQLSRVAVHDLKAVWFADGRVIEPIGRLSHVLKRVVDGVQDAVRANFNHHVGQCLCTKIATSSDVEVLPQVLAYGQLCFRPNSGFGYAMVNAPNSKRLRGIFYSKSPE